VGHTGLSLQLLEVINTSEVVNGIFEDGIVLQLEALLPVHDVHINRRRWRDGRRPAGILVTQLVHVTERGVGRGGGARQDGSVACFMRVRVVAAGTKVMLIAHVSHGCAVIVDAHVRNEDLPASCKHLLQLEQIIVQADLKPKN
jgi:hypothetical protein